MRGVSDEVSSDSDYEESLSLLGLEWAGVAGGEWHVVAPAMSQLSDVGRNCSNVLYDKTRDVLEYPTGRSDRVYYSQRIE